MNLLADESQTCRMKAFGYINRYAGAVLQGLSLIHILFELSTSKKSRTVWRLTKASFLLAEKNITRNIQDFWTPAVHLTTHDQYHYQSKKLVRNIHKHGVTN